MFYGPQLRSASAGSPASGLRKSVETTPGRGTQCTQGELQTLAAALRAAATDPVQAAALTNSSSHHMNGDGRTRDGGCNEENRVQSLLQQLHTRIQLEEEGPEWAVGCVNDSQVVRVNALSTRQQSRSTSNNFNASTDNSGPENNGSQGLANSPGRRAGIICTDEYEPQMREFVDKSSCYTVENTTHPMHHPMHRTSGKPPQTHAMSPVYQPETDCSDIISVREVKDWIPEDLSLESQKPLQGDAMQSHSPSRLLNSPEENQSQNQAKNQPVDQIAVNEVHRVSLGLQSPVRPDYSCPPNLTMAPVVASPLTSQVASQSTATPFYHRLLPVIMVVGVTTRAGEANTRSTSIFVALSSELRLLIAAAGVLKRKYKGHTQLTVSLVVCFVLKFLCQL